MSQISRVPITWAGSPVVGGGFTVFHCTVGDEHALMTAWRAFLVAEAGAFPTGLQWSFPTAGPIINQETGALEDAWADGSAPAPTSGTSTNTFADGVGVRMKWTTGSFYNGHQVVGSTFLVPLQIAAYEGAGNILDSYITSFNTAAATFVAAAGLRVWSRPRTGVVGQSFAVNGGSCPDKVSWLRGRRT